MWKVRIQLSYPGFTRTDRSRPIAVFASVDFNAGKPTSADRCNHRLNDCLPETLFSEWAPAIDQEPVLGSGASKQPFDEQNSHYRSLIVNNHFIPADCSCAVGAFGDVQNMGTRFGPSCRQSPMTAVRRSNLSCQTAVSSGSISACASISNALGKQFAVLRNDTVLHQT